MPLPKRVIEPVHVARGTLPEDFPLVSELEAVTNGTLANTVRQLSSLSKHAEDLFGELARDAQQLYDRSNSLQARIDRLAIKVTQLDSTVEEVSLQDIHMRKAFKSTVAFDQQIFSRATMPTAMLETYHSCDKPPPLHKLNCYRDDGKDGLKFYTDPNYFFELWRQEMLNDTERMMHDRGKKPHRPRTEGGQGNRHKKRVRQPHNTRERQKQIAVGHGEYIMPQQNTIYRTPQPIIQQQQQMLPTEEMIEPRPPRPNSIEIRRSYQQETTDGLHSPTYPPYEEYGQGPLSSESLYQGGTPTRGGKVRPSQPPPAPPSNTSTPSSNTPTRGRSLSGRDNLPPPPPPPDTTMSPPNGIPAHLATQSRSNSPHQATPPEPVQDLPPPPPIPKQASPPKQQTPQAPPPPPPPPMPLLNGPTTSPPLVNGDLAKIINSASPPQLTPVKDRPKQAPPIVDPRNDLLKAIRDGIKLRKVEKIEQKEVERGNGFHDVASILARRVAVEFSDSDSGSDSECDSEGWGENETSA
ncbi:actin-binding protein WASF3 [Tribolium castaneum]|uniref:Wiskott-Aldrich syndrome protein family member n=1 Tax=Tribolium castaneum TaxID=7070 RepID=D6WUN3_TRICA|nr:PREDICTED: wiskott-Aldrich syndrome protein family member 3 [Tribolium castaneum]XP_973241.1 PREDICTED: wiskott-Aldrich syndrome protein family member 3 [Tribolium castaneum]EFA08500.1 Wiskott-Aldrich syndrome protein family member 3-like Protein [Tribolium castaneum]|eukprot:XP_015837872.1 PREDICTED: wiskott-Aldrich syndrome protein family member 3 [Tribolium castaneum]